MSPLWQFKAVSVFLDYSLPHAPSSQPFLILHFVAACAAPLFPSGFHNQLRRSTEACAAESACLCERGRCLVLCTCTLDFKDKLKGNRPDGSQAHGHTSTSTPSHTAAPARAAAAPRRSPPPPSVIKSLIAGGFGGRYYFKPAVKSINPFSKD